MKSNCRSWLIVVIVIVAIYLLKNKQVKTIQLQQENWTSINSWPWKRFRLIQLRCRWKVTSENNTMNWEFVPSTPIPLSLTVFGETDVTDFWKKNDCVSQLQEVNRSEYIMLLLYYSIMFLSVISKPELWKMCYFVKFQLLNFTTSVQASARYA